MRMSLPAQFMENMREQLGDDADKLFAALQEPYTRGLRLNPRKPVLLDEDLSECVPWWQEGRYLPIERAAGAHPLHEAGAYYIQEPSAMSPVAVLAPKPGERVLDLCAAPGGKSTQIADALQGEGLLVSNEPVPSRAKILSRNIERMGVTNALVVSAEPETLAARWKNAFDAVLVDAPCSGEGMFRRHEETRAEWSASSPEGCAVRQKRILQSAVQMLKTGGRLVYSTCTFNTAEDDGIVEWLTSECPFMRLEGFSLPSGDNRTMNAPKGCMHLYPHEIRGEGHFIAQLVKTGSTEGQTEFLPADRRLSKPDKAVLEAWKFFAEDMRISGIKPDAAFGDALIAAPELPPLDGIKVLRAGLVLGAMKGRVFAPDHALAMGLCAENVASMLKVELTLEEAREYQSGAELHTQSPVHGWALAVYSGLPLGFVKVSGGAAKNHYPKGLRRDNRG